MKKTILLLLIAPLLLAMQCDPDEEPCGKLIQTQKNDLITIENLQTSYNLNDVIWLNASIDQEQQIGNITYNLFETDEKLAYVVELTKQSVYNPNNYLSLNEQTTIVDKGEVEGNNFILTKEGNRFQNRIGIRLLETGTYTLALYNIASYNWYRPDCNFTAFSFETDFNEIESGSVTFTVE